MICAKKKVVFIHIPKNAGTSVSAALDGHLGKLNPLQKLVNSVSKRVIGDRVFKPLEKLRNHATASEYIENLGDQYWQMYSFTFARNPFDRMVSLFHYIQQTPFHFLHNEVREMAFREFVSFVRYKPLVAPTQASFFMDNEGNCLVNKIGRVETVETDFRDVCRSLNENIILAHVNQSKRKDFSGYYDAELTEAVANLYQQDFDVLGYNTDPSCTKFSTMQLKMHPRLEN